MTEIQENAIFIADSHYPHHGDAFLDLLKKLDSGKVQTSQLFLMGDNFDLLFGYNDYIQTFSKEAIHLLQKLSTKIEIHYFEGNHDFCLSEIFPHIHVYSREQQPVYCTLNEKNVAISHGDKFETGVIYNIYCKLLRNKIFFVTLKPFEKPLIHHRIKSLSKKHICKNFDGFESHVKSILKHYNNVDFVIEGHFHQAKIVGKYISLPSQACQGKVAIVEEGKIVFKSL